MRILCGTILVAAVAVMSAASAFAAAPADGLALPLAEFAKYHEAITGRGPDDGALRLAIDPLVSKSGKDAYTIVSEGSGVAITGSNLRSVFYGVYDLLERRGGCHWFWDGDVVPRRDAIDLAGLDVHEEAQFEWRGLRYFAHRGLTRFQAEQWGPDDWKKEIDWCLKRRLNVFMLRIGQDDLFQRAFPDVVAYPDASKDLPGHGEGYDNRTLFWSLEYRGKLRRELQHYAFDRGLEVPEDFGTMTHWYSRTPEDFLEKFNPPFLPQATSGYKERNGLVWDIRDDKWVDEYWKLTKTAVDAYGRQGPGLLHTIGLGERLCFTNRADNLKLKLLALDKFLSRAHRDYPERKVLLAGWDFYFTWFPEEVQALVKTLDPKRDIIWDYEGDATRDYRPEMNGQHNNFTKWGVIGKFPYTYSIFLAFESALDIRANYPIIEERQKIVQNDPFCAGYVLWPEASHTDTLCLRYFTANAWTKGGVSSANVLDEFCASRYGGDAEAWKSIWRRVVPMSYLMGWGENYGRAVATNYGDGTGLYNDAKRWADRRVPAQLASVPDVMRALAALDWRKTQFTERDAIDLARTAGDRMVVAARDDMMRAYHSWRTGGASASEVLRKADAYARMGALMADILALHTDYSLAESFDRMNAIEPVRNPNFPRVLIENATCHYCASHQYEAAEYWYKPFITDFASMVANKVSSDDRTPIPALPKWTEFRDKRMYAKPLTDMRPTLPRTQENYAKTLTAFANAAEAFAGERVDVHPHQFVPGGWNLDVQFMDVMGSPYLIAHGKGIRVADATAYVEIPRSGAWRVWVRSRKWADGAGLFAVRVNGAVLPKTFGAAQSEWEWEDGDVVKLQEGRCDIALVDRDGFDGRCAGIVLTLDGERPHGALDFASAPCEDVEADLVVVGGGLPGTCAAVAAARRGVRVALVQDRPVLGGNASSEIRVWSAGEMRHPIVKELRGWFMNRDANMAISDAHRLRVVQDETNICLRLSTRAFGVEKDGSRISAVRAFDWARGRLVRFRAPLFCDATGDGWVGFYAGADFRTGREAKSEFGETFAPEKADGDTLGASLMWTSAVANAPVPFSAPWAEPHAQGEVAVNGEWNWEYGIHRDMVAEGEAIRDRLLLAVYGAFSLAKRNPVNSRRVLDFLPFVLGKRESRRLMGDWIYSESDVAEKREFPDAVATGSWSVDLHYDDCKPGVDFLTTCRQPHYGRYWIPYRSLYSRNVENLFMAGRCFSCTHVGLGGVRVMNTLAQLGVAVGEAAAMCRRLGVMPRGIWTGGHARELQRLIGGDFPGNPDPAYAGWRIVDDEDDGVKFYGAWREEFCCCGGQVGDKVHEPTKKAEKAVYPLPVEKPGRYRLMGRTNYCWYAKEDSETAIAVVSDNRRISLKWNQAVNSGEWNEIGVLDLVPGSTLEIDVKSSRGTVVADAFAIVDTARD